MMSKKGRLHIALIFLILFIIIVIAFLFFFLNRDSHWDENPPGPPIVNFQWPDTRFAIKRSQYYIQPIDEINIPFRLKNEYDLKKRFSIQLYDRTKYTSPADLALYGRIYPMQEADLQFDFPDKPILLDPDKYIIFNLNVITNGIPESIHFMRIQICELEEDKDECSDESAIYAMKEFFVEIKE